MKDPVAVAGPPKPDMMHHITVGFNSTIRHLQGPAGTNLPTTPVFGADEKLKITKKLAVVFVCTSTLPVMLTSSIPTLVAAASARHPSDSPIRLVALPIQAEKRLADAISLLRVGFVGILQDAPGAQALVDIAREKARSVDIPWLKAESLV